MNIYLYDINLKRFNYMQIRLIHSKNFSARGIQIFMKLFCILRGIKPPKIIYNHALIYDEKTDELYEADFPHVVKMSFSKWKEKKKNKTALIEMVNIEFTQDEEIEIKKYLEAQVGKHYEISNFWWHIAKVFTGKWYGRKDDKRHYCYELVLYALNTLKKNNFDAYLNPYEFSKNFKVYDTHQ
jgi:hypothetical protein